MGSFLHGPVLASPCQGRWHGEGRDGGVDNMNKKRSNATEQKRASMKFALRTPLPLSPRNSSDSSPDKGSREKVVYKITSYFAALLFGLLTTRRAVGACRFSRPLIFASPTSRIGFAHSPTHLPRNTHAAISYFAALLFCLLTTRRARIQAGGRHCASPWSAA